MSGSKKEVNYSKQKMKSRIAWIIATIFAVFLAACGTGSICIYDSELLTKAV